MASLAGAPTGIDHPATLHLITYCIEKISDGSYAKWEAIKNAVNAILQGHISVGNHLDPFVDVCIESIQNKWATQDILAQTLGQLGSAQKLTAQQIDKVVKLTLERMQNASSGTTPQIELMNSVLAIHQAGLLTKTQRESFVAMCGAGVISNWSIKDKCQQVISILVP